MRKCDCGDVLSAIQFYFLKDMINNTLSLQWNSILFNQDMYYEPGMII